MFRRKFLSLLSGPSLSSLLGACAPVHTLASPPPASAPRGAGALAGRRVIRAICFDLFTLFDPRSVVAVARQILPATSTPAQFCETWRARQFEYCWLRGLAGKYLDFRAVTEAALEYAADAHHVPLTHESRRTLVDAYSQLEPWPDARRWLGAWRSAGLRLAPLSNYSPSMLEALLGNSKLRDSFDALLSTDAVQSYKPAARAYALGEAALGLERGEIAFAAFGGWDAAGAKWFGFPTFWVNRLGVSAEHLAPGPDGSGPSLSELDRFVKEWHRTGGA
jgi:2-haloacid dehalogenase